MVSLQAPTSRKKIVDAVLPAGDIEHMEVNMNTLAEALGSSAPDPVSKADQYLQWCARWGLIHNELQCLNCPGGHQMSLTKDKGKTDQFVVINELKLP